MSVVAYYKRRAYRLVEAKQQATSKPLLYCIRAVAAELRAPYGSIWGLVYREPKGVKPAVQRALDTALLELISGEIVSLEHELRGLVAWSTFTHAGEIEEVEADLAALKERLAKLRAGRP